MDTAAYALSRFTKIVNKSGVDVWFHASSGLPNFNVRHGVPVFKPARMFHDSSMDATSSCAIELYAGAECFDVLTPEDFIENIQINISRDQVNGRMIVTRFKAKPGDRLRIMALSCVCGDINGRQEQPMRT